MIKKLPTIRFIWSGEADNPLAKILRLTPSLVALIFCTGGFFPTHVIAACTASSNPTADCTDLIWTTGNVSNGYTISSSGGAVPALRASSSAGVFTNTSSGVVSAGSIPDGAILSFATSASIYNYGSIVGGNAGIWQDSGTISTLFNANLIRGTANAILANGQITNLINTGTLTATSSLDSIISIQAAGTISTLTNAGAISGGFSGIDNFGSIGTLNNSQGGNGSSAANTALIYSQGLPTNYNIIVRSTSHYGQLSYRSVTGTTTTFGIYGGGVSGVAASTLNKGTYSSVLSGVAASNLTGATKGNYNGFTWSLSQVDTINGIWNLLVTGASTADTQQSLINTSAALQNTFTLQNTVLANSLSYDCTVFGANDVCISAGGRNTQVSAANGLNNTSALLIAAYRVMPTVRVGAYADQNLSVNNAGSTVNLGNNTPLIGLFGAWNERLDGTGTEVKVSAAYGQKNTTVTRQVVGTSEAGSGSSQLNSQGAQVAAKYGFGVTPDVIVSPYVGIRYTQNNMGGYTEGASSSVTAPLTYSALNTNATTVLAGVGAQYRFIPQATAFASAGVESDTNTNNGTYSATGIAGLTPLNFNANPVKNRPTATVGAYYDVEKNQRLGVIGIYRQEFYQAVSTTTVMATYTVGF